jgi:hypothetical protein
MTKNHSRHSTTAASRSFLAFAMVMASIVPLASCGDGPLAALPLAPSGITTPILGLDLADDNAAFDQKTN